MLWTHYGTEADDFMMDTVYSTEADAIRTRIINHCCVLRASRVTNAKAAAPVLGMGGGHNDGLQGR
jgi:hypothetical protein